MAYLSKELQAHRKQESDPTAIWRRMRNLYAYKGPYWDSKWKQELTDLLFPEATEQRRLLRDRKKVAKAEAKRLEEASHPKSIYSRPLVYAEPNPFQLPARRSP